MFNRLSPRGVQNLAFGLIAAAAATFGGVSPAEAKLWRNAYVSFEMPDTWNCALESTEWVCRSGDGKESREAIIILTAKEVGPMDSFEAYISHLNTAQQVNYRTMGPSTSRVIYPPKRVSINEHPWVDGLHLGSEVPSYFTRYLATIKDKIAVLVTFSAHRDHYAKYSSAFFRAVNSLRVIANRNLLSDTSVGPLNPSAGSSFSNAAGAIPSDLEGGEAGFGGVGGSGGTMKTVMMLIAALIGAAGIYIYLKSRKQS
jgi:hypothetical protein